MESVLVTAQTAPMVLLRETRDGKHVVQPPRDGAPFTSENTSLYVEEQTLVDRKHCVHAFLLLTIIVS